MGEYDWLDLNMPEHRQFLLTAANSLHEDLKEANAYREKYEEQVIYIKELENQVRLLHKTLDVIEKNRGLVRKVKKWQRSNGLRFAPTFSTMKR